jgi:ribosome biogenesis protein YTM1
LASASWDKSIRLWNSSRDNEHSKATLSKKNKKQKLQTAVINSETGSLEGHTGSVSSVSFDNESSHILYSGSWDHSVRVWDINTMENTHTMVLVFL